MKNSIESIRSGLGTQLSEVDDELAAAAARTRELRETRRRVASALRALGGDEQAVDDAKPAPKKAQVIEAVHTLLADNRGEIPLSDLEPLVADKLAQEHGCSAMGLALRMREALATGQFVTAEGQVRLAVPAKNRSPTPI